MRSMNVATVHIAHAVLVDGKRRDDVETSWVSAVKRVREIFERKALVLVPVLVVWL